MQRKMFFTKGLGLAGLGATLLEACKKTAAPQIIITPPSAHPSTNTCYTPTEEEGPFPYSSDGRTKSEISNPLKRSDITTNSSDGVVQPGLPLSLIITVVDSKNSCKLVSGARVDVWHCNHEGWYSGYGAQVGGIGTNNNYVDQNWLRGYQESDTSGVANFTSIYPGWYALRATHVHFEVFLNGILRKQTQLAFPQLISNAVHVTTVYSAHGINPTTNSHDPVFKNSISDLASETLILNGNTTNGYTATYTIALD